MADFHGYVLTITAKVTLPANADGSPAPLMLVGVPADVARVLARQLPGASVQLPVASADAPTPVTVA
jgi:hypothetical protein